MPSVSLTISYSFNGSVVCAGEMSGDIRRVRHSKVCLMKAPVNLFVTTAPGNRKFHEHSECLHENSYAVLVLRQVGSTFYSFPGLTLVDDKALVFSAISSFPLPCDDAKPDRVRTRSDDDRVSPREPDIDGIRLGRPQPDCPGRGGNDR